MLKWAKTALAVAASVGVFEVALAETLQPDFTFRRIGLPEPDATRRITVQIEPRPEAPEDPPAVAAVVDEPQGADHWFWGRIAPGLDQDPALRTSQALQLIEQPPSGTRVFSPRLDHLSGIASAHGIAILRETVGTNVSPALVLAVIAVESAGRPDAVSGAGAQGLMQLMPATAARFGVSDSFDPAQNIAGGVAYLDWLLQEFDRDTVIALAGYNAGEGSVRRHDGVPPFAETRDYVPKVLAAWRIARGLCLTPPELISDPCVFAVSGG